MSDHLTHQSSEPYDVHHKAELQKTAMVKYIPIGSPAVRALLGEGNFRTREDAVQGAMDVHEKIALRERVDKLGIDSMTGLATRTIFDEQLPRYIKRAEANYRQGKKGVTAVILADLNNLKGANDLDKSHAKGDSYIVTAAESLKATSRPGDFLSRVGGDEFAEILGEVLPDVLEDGSLDYDAPLQRIVESKRQAANTAVRSLEELPTELNPGVSFGFSYFQDGDTQADFIKRADSMLYEDKQNK